jgi:hypothetical protein
MPLHTQTAKIELLLDELDMLHAMVQTVPIGPAVTLIKFPNMQPWHLVHSRRSFAEDLVFRSTKTMRLTLFYCKTGQMPTGFHRMLHTLSLVSSNSLPKMSHCSWATVSPTCLILLHGICSHCEGVLSLHIRNLLLNPLSCHITTLPPHQLPIPPCQ